MAFSKNPKVPKWIRRLLIAMIMLFFGTVVFLLLLCGVLLWKEHMLAAIFFLFIGLWFLIMSVRKCKQMDWHGKDEHREE